MSAPVNPRRPQAFAVDDPAVQPSPIDSGPGQSSEGADSQSYPETDADRGSEVTYQPRKQLARKGLRWGAILLSAVGSLVMLAATASFMRFVSETIAGNDWLAWTAFGLLIIALIALVAITAREIAGILRLRQLRRFRQQVDRALASQDRSAERRCIRRLKAIYKERADMTWALARFRDHEQEVVDAGDLLTLAERDLIQPLDRQAEVLITTTAKRVSLVTAISPIAIFDVLFVLAENLSLLRRLATLYGARPGFLGGLRLARMVVGHLIATGGLALTDDLVGQILGHDIVRKLSQRIGEGVFNGALSARIGIAAIEILRPLPYIEATPLRLRDLVGVIFRKSAKPQQD